MFVILNKISNIGQVRMRIEIQWNLPIEKVTHFYTKYNYHIWQHIFYIFQNWCFFWHLLIFNFLIWFRAIWFVLFDDLLSRFIVRVLKICKQKHNQHQAICNWISFSSQSLTENQESPHKLSYYITWKVLMICHIFISSSNIHFHHKKT